MSEQSTQQKQFFVGPMKPLTMLPRLGSSFWGSFLKAKQQILISLSQPAISPSLPNKTTKADSPSPYADDIAADS